MTYLGLQNVQKQYGAEMALHIDKLCIDRGSIVSVVGPNGSGKTTLLRILGLLDNPSAGNVWLDSKQLSFSNSAGSEIRKKIVMVQQFPYMFHGSVFFNVAFGLAVRNIDKNEMRNRVDKALNMLGLSELRDRQAQELSAGETQRVGLARGLVVQPELLLLDEPTANVDKAHLEHVKEAIVCAGREWGATVVFATHNIELGVGLADESLYLAEGRLTDTPLRNHFAGMVVEKEGEKSVQTASGVSISVLTERRGKVHLAIDPRDILISTAPIESSARNLLKGIIVGLNREDAAVRVTVDVGISLDSIVTVKSLEKMDMKLEKAVYAVFKTSSVKVY